MSNRTSKLSPLHTTAQMLGAQFEDRAGWAAVSHYGDPRAEAKALAQGVGLFDGSASGKLLVEGNDAAAILQQVFTSSAPDVGASSAAGPGFTYALRADRFLVHLPPGEEGATLAALTEAAAANATLVTVTNVTHGRGELWLVGPNSAELLSRLCGLDFHQDRFPNGTVKQSSVAKTSQIIIAMTCRHDMGDRRAYILIGARSLAAYLWETLVEAGADLGLRPIGAQVLNG